MGYYIYLLDHSIHIKKEHFDAALEAVKTAFPKNKAIRAMTAFEDAMCEFYYIPEFNDVGDICGFQFEGEKYCGDELFWSAVAPYMEYGDYIEMEGEDFCHWRWSFQNGVCKEIEPKIIWRMNEMSMRDYSVHDFGYVFTAEMIDKIIEAKHPDNINPGDTYEMAEHMGLEYIGDFTGEAIPLDEKGDDDFRNDNISYSGDSIFYFPICSYSSLFQAAYQSPDELARCMKARYPKWLPDDLDEIYKGIRHIVGTSFG